MSAANTSLSFTATAYQACDAQALPIYHGIHFRNRLTRKKVIVSILHARLAPPGSNLEPDTAISEETLVACSVVGENATQKRQTIASLLLTDCRILQFDISGPFEQTPKRIGTFNLQRYELVDFVPLVNYGLHAGCSHDETIKFFDAKFDLVGAALAWMPVLNIQYDEKLDTVLAISKKHVSFWTVKAYYEKGSLNAAAEEIGRIEIDSDDWINVVHSVSHMNRIYVASGSTIFAFSSIDFSQLFHLKLISGKTITSLQYHRDSQYLFSGSCDGCIQVWESNQIMLHEFLTKCKPITSLRIYSKSMLLSCSEDHTIQLWDIKVFKVCLKIDVEEPVKYVQLFHDNILGVTTFKGFSIWSIEYFKHNFSTINSSITYLQSTAGYLTPPKVLFGSGDGVWRITSPDTGKVITACIPPHQRFEIIDTAYSTDSDTLFFLIRNGDIMISKTNTNPAVFIDLWHIRAGSTEISVKICCMDFSYRGIFYTFLFGANRAGQIILYSVSGTAARRWNLHSSEIVSLQANKNNIFTLGVDNYIKISEILPGADIFLTTRQSIPVENIPAAFCIAEDVVVTCSSNGTIQFYPRNGQQGEIKDTKSDHNGPGIACLELKRHGLLATLAHDGILKVWDAKKTLIREIIFDRPPSKATLLNLECDILMVWGSSIEILPYYEYIPEKFVNTCLEEEYEKLAPEEPLELKNHSILQLRKKVVEGLFRINFMHLLNFCDKQLVQRKLVVPNVSYRFKSRNQNIPTEENIDKVNRESADLRFRKKSDILEDNALTLNSLVSFINTIPNLSQGVTNFGQNYIHYSGITKTHSDSTKVAKCVTSESKQLPYSISGAGVIPNSCVQRQYSDYKFCPLPPAIRRPLMQKVLNHSKNETNERISEFRKRLQYLISIFPDTGKFKQVNTSIQAREKYKSVKYKITSDGFYNPEALEDLPILIQKALEFQIFQEKELFKIKTLSSKPGSLQRSWIVEPTADGLQPFLVKAFDSSDLLTKKELLTFIVWIHEDYGFTSIGPIFESFLRFTHNCFLEPKNSVVKDLLTIIFRFFSNYLNTYTDIMVEMLVYTIVGDPDLESLALEQIKLAGVEHVNSNDLRKKLNELCTQAKQKCEKQKQPNNHPALLRSNIISWFRQICSAYENQKKNATTKSDIFDHRGKRRATLISDRNSQELTTVASIAEDKTLVDILNLWIRWREEQNVKAEEEKRAKQLKQEMKKLAEHKRNKEERAVAEKVKKKPGKVGKPKFNTNKKSKKKLKLPKIPSRTPSIKDSKKTNVTPPLEQPKINRVPSPIEQQKIQMPVEVVCPSPFAESDSLSLSDDRFQTFTGDTSNPSFATTMKNYKVI